MNGSTPDYYAILGLMQATSPDDIKKRYRELARRYHPDVNSTPEAAHKIKQINEAYHVLGDSDRRSLYDAERSLRGETSRTVETPPERPARPQPQRARQTESGQGFGFDGFGRTSRADSPSTGPADSRRSAEPESPARPPQAARPPRQPARGAGFSASWAPPSERSTGRPGDSANANPSGALVQGIVSEAQIAFINRRYHEAETLCQEALRLDRRNAVAYEIMGDIYSRRGQRESATTAYSYAIQFNPRNFSVHGKLDRVIGRGEPVAVGPVMANHAHQAPRPKRTGTVGNHAAQIPLSILLVLAFAFVLYVLSDSRGTPMSDGTPWIGALSANMLIALTCNGVIGGILLAFFGGMRPAGEVLGEIYSRDSGRVDAAVPAFVLVATALVSFYLSVGAYAFMSIARRTVSASILRLYAAAGIMMAIFACTLSQSATSNGLSDSVKYGGNVLFPAALAGWFIGDSIRLRGR